MSRFAVRRHIEVCSCRSTLRWVLFDHYRSAHYGHFKTRRAAREVLRIAKLAVRRGYVLAVDPWKAGQP